MESARDREPRVLDLFGEGGGVLKVNFSYKGLQRSRIFFFGNSSAKLWFAHSEVEEDDPEPRGYLGNSHF